MLKNIYLKRPFKVRNADEYNLSEILSLFVIPSEGLASPFDYENIIVKGRMGSGKTMYLRANYAYYLYNIVPNLLENDELILPVFIKLSDFQHLSEPSEIYRAIIVKIVADIAETYINLQDSHKMAKIHLGIRSLKSGQHVYSQLNKSLTSLMKLDSHEYIEKLSTEFGIKGEVQHSFLKASANYKENNLIELKKKSNPGIKDIEEAYNNLLAQYNGKLIILLDEAGSLDKKFFHGSENNSFFEILMNQLRTASYVRTKIAIYPNSYQDILTETRYGDTILLEDNINSTDGYSNFRSKTISLINNYLSVDEKTIIKANRLFNYKNNEIYGDCIEQLINASNGNMRKLIQLLDSTMEQAYSKNKGKRRIQREDVQNALIQNSYKTESLYSENERELLNNLVSACKSRSTYKFQFPNMSPSINKYTSRSQESNLINVLEIGVGRKSTTYAFDYSYSVANGLPTHAYSRTQRLNRDRTLQNGEWIKRVAKISPKTLEQASMANKINGQIEYENENRGFIKGDDNKSYYFTDEFIVDEDKLKEVARGRNVRFLPLKVGEGTILAQEIELL